MVGTQIGNYRIQEKIGEGGMGVVYKGVDVNLDRVVAIKALNTELRGNAELEQRFRAEAKAQANLNHTNLATLYTLLIEDGRPFMVMEFIEGETFEQMVQRRGPIPAEEAIPLFRQALLGIGQAHRMGIVHRDIKPSNLMLNRQGIVKVMDFGIAKVLGGRGMTRTGTQMGTAFYMSPEQVLNRNVDIRSDIYSLGVTLYEMLTANVPFSGDSDYQIMSDHVNTPPPMLTKFYPYVPPGVQNAVLKAIEKSQDARFQSVEEFGAALEQPNDFGVAPGAVPVSAPAAYPRATVVENTPRYTAPGVPPAVAAGMMPGVAPGAPTGFPPAATHAATQAATAAPSRSRDFMIIGGALLTMLVLAGAWLALRPGPKVTPLPPALPPVTNTGTNIAPSTDTNVTALSSSTPVQGQARPVGGQTQNRPASRPQTNQTPPRQAQARQTSPPQASQPAPDTPNQNAAPPPAPPPAPAPAPVAAAPVVIPAGTLITVRMIDNVDSSRDTPGRRFQASVDEPIAAVGRIAVPRGATAGLVMTNVAQAGHIEGRNAVALELVTLTIGRNIYTVRSTLFEKEGPSRGQRSAEVIGGGAAVGAVVGGIFGHGKGAAAGAAAGAGAGTGAQYMTRAAPVTIPSETRINFTLRSPVTVGP